ncbi:TPA: hypothetical protein ACX3KH_001323 [Raoultella ornithinolytica]|uniref:hypothetical protein n=1 Tax=Klebsiella TaxID=570 RepID=UPI0015D77917|nr:MULTISPECIES: hypothetical protein [Klebsiella]BCH46865.1 hypothetical protein KAM260_47560 [Klebsiella pneumoniae]HAZ3450979.1 hypothetical protein [Raoultella ornithinolytica]HDH1792439.1 hypothetical protein [Klebsiella quasipneumoniae subsp. similipneumoniae]MEE1969325.1 hypothetical protein [Klebsiella michiganensis]HDT5898618.1 hypothetical protein [Raoultella ornithinolytica]
MDISDESQALSRIKWNVAGQGLISEFIYSTKPGHLIFDVHLWELAIKGPQYVDLWDVDVFAQKMIVLPFKSINEFKKVYGLARMMRGFVREGGNHGKN